jgi:hypothetical protein
MNWGAHRDRPGRVAKTLRHRRIRLTRLPAKGMEDIITISQNLKQNTN